MDPYEVTWAADQDGNAHIMLGEDELGVIPVELPEELFIPARDVALYWAQKAADTFRPE